MLWCNMTSLHECPSCQSINLPQSDMDPSELKQHWIEFAKQLQTSQRLQLWVSLFHFPTHDEWPLLCCSVCASVLVCCMYSCLHAPTLPFYRPLSCCCNSCSPFTIVYQKNTTHALIPTVAASRAWFWPRLYCFSSCWEVDRLHSYFYTLNLILCWFQTAILLYMETLGGPRGTRGPLSHSL